MQAFAPSRLPVASPAAAAAAARRYRDAELDQRVAAASPHELVSMLYDAAKLALIAAERATIARDARARVQQVTRALAILDGLDGTLDHGRGGAVARALESAYAQMRALLVAANSEVSAELFAAAAARMATIGSSWKAIAPGRAIAA